MGIMMDFYAGDARRIAEVENDPDEFEGDLSSAPFVRAHVDFSLHMTPDQLDPLVEAACARRRVPRVKLTTSLVEHLAGSTDPIEAEFSADVVAPEVVEVLGSLRDDELHDVAEDWFREVGAELTPDAEAAVSGLVALCRIARAERIPVVFSWSL